MQAVHTANAVSAQKLDSAGDRVEFWSRTFGSPAESTFITAMERGFIKPPGLTVLTVKRHKHRLRTRQAAAGHLDQVRQNIKAHSCKDHTASPQDTSIFTCVYSEQNHMDSCGRFPAISYRGHQYIMIMYSENGNYIKGIPLKDRSQASALQSYIEVMIFFESVGL